MMETIDLSRFAEMSLFAVAFLSMLRWMMTRFERELKNIIQSQAQTNKTVAALSIVIVALQKQLLTHDLTVHGINPSTGVGQEERSQIAVKKYEELKHILDEVSATLSRLID